MIKKVAILVIRWIAAGHVYGTFMKSCHITAPRIRNAF